MHVAGAKRLVQIRGGINAVRQTSPLTARMVSWYVKPLAHKEHGTYRDVVKGFDDCYRLPSVQHTK